MKCAVLLIGLVLSAVMIVESDISQYRLYHLKQQFAEDIGEPLQATLSAIEEAKNQIEIGKSGLDGLAEEKKKKILEEFERLETNLKNLQNRCAEIGELTQKA